MSSRQSSLVGVNYLVDIISTYSSLHMEYYPRNYRIFLELEGWEQSFLGWIKDDMLLTPFFYDCPHIRRGIKRIIGNAILFPTGKRLIYPSHILPVFLSNSMELLQSPFHVELLAARFIRSVYLHENKLSKFCQRYDH